MEFSKELDDLIDKYYKTKDSSELLQLLEDEEKPLREEWVRWRGVWSQSSLHSAVLYNDEALTTALLEKGADPEAADRIGQTPVHLASLYGCTSLLKVLTKHSARIDVVDKWGQTAAHLTAQNNHSDTLRWIVQEDSGASLLHKQGGDYTIYSTSLKNHAKVSGPTPLHLAAVCGHLESVQTLIDLGSNPQILDNDNQTALDLFLKYRKDMKASDELDKLKQVLTSVTNSINKEKVGADSGSQSASASKGAELKPMKRPPTAKDVKRQLESSVQTAVGSLTFSLNHSMKELEVRYSSLTKELQTNTKGQDTTQKHLRSLLDMIDRLQRKLTEKTQEVQKGLTVLIQQNEEQLANLCQQDHMNEYVYYKVFQLVASHVGFRAGKWKSMCQELLAGYPQDFIDTIVSETDQQHNTNKDKAYECLIRWKVYTARYADKLEPLKRVLKKLDMPDIDAEIDAIVKHHVHKASIANVGSLTDQGMDKLASQIGNEWQSLALNLDFSLARIQQLKMDNPDTRSCVAAMLIEWRNREDGFTDIKLARLAEALIRVQRVSLAKQLTLGH